MLGYGYGRMCITRADHIQQIRHELTRLSVYIPDRLAFRDVMNKLYYRLNQLKWLDDRMPMPYPELSTLQQTTDYLRYGSSTGLVDAIRVTHTIWNCLKDWRQLYALLNDLLFLVEDVVLRDQAVYESHVKESGKAWRDESLRNNR